jgi:Fe-S cluster assembly scaffold protein SufB
VRAGFADLAAERRCVELEKLRIMHRDAVAGWNKSAIERDNARQSLRAAEADAAETESVNSDLRNANRRLVADLAAAMERLNHAESIIMQ